MGYSLSQSFISGQPPLLVFTICLTAFGLTMVILAYVIGEQDVPNPDVQMVNLTNLLCFNRDI